jgi:hypothetical protein
VTTDEALAKSRELLRAIANMTPEVGDFVETESQIEVLTILERTEFVAEGDAKLAVYGTVAALYPALDRLPEKVRREMERDEGSLLHEVGRWHARIFSQPSFADGVARGRHVTQILADARGVASDLRSSIDALLETEPHADARLRQVLEGWNRSLAAAESEMSRHHGYAVEDPSVFWAGQMVSEAAFALAKVAWSAVAIFAYSSVKSDPTAVSPARDDLLESARAAGAFVASWVGSWKD